MKSRLDIQALRGIAVLLVVCFHAQLPPFRAGHLGVDVFFVISGFLITGMIARSLENGSFRLSAFYFRRAKRLLPAAYLTFACSAVWAAFLLTSVELRDFANQLLGAVTFTGNIVLWRQGTYFGGDADLRPLLHTWSLAIEEQYYLVLPATLWLMPRKWWLRAAAFAVIASLAACIYTVRKSPGAAFYLFPTRAWELGLGSLGALGGAQLSRRWYAWAPLPALLAIAAVAIFPLSHVHPGADAVVACVATLLVLLAAPEALFQNLPGRALALVGDFSYSLYLVHWPIFAIARNLWVGPVPASLMVLLVLLSVGLSYLQYRYVENPVRHMRVEASLRSVAVALAASMLLLVIAYALPRTRTARPDYAHLRRGNTGLDDSCPYKDEFVPRPQCATSANPNTLVWGDSYAMHTVPGIIATARSTSVIQATKYVCGPLVGLAPLTNTMGGTQTRAWAEGCLGFNDSVLAYLAKTPSVTDVVLASVFMQYVTPSDYRVLLREGDAQLVERDGDVPTALTALDRTIRSVRALGRRVVVVGPPPALEFDAGRCVERLQRGLTTYGDFHTCTFPAPTYRAYRKAVLELLDLVQRNSDVRVVDFDAVFYDPSTNAYATMLDGAPAFIANGHFSYDGSAAVARHMGLTPMLLKAAR